MAAPDGTQFGLILPGLAVLVADATGDEAGGDGLPFLRGERGVAGLGDLGIADPAGQLVVPTAWPANLATPRAEFALPPRSPAIPTSNLRTHSDPFRHRRRLGTIRTGRHCDVAVGLAACSPDPGSRSQPGNRGNAPGKVT